MKLIRKFKGIGEGLNFGLLSIVHSRATRAAAGAVSPEYRAALFDLIAALDRVANFH